MSVPGEQGAAVGLLFCPPPVTTAYCCRTRHCDGRPGDQCGEGVVTGAKTGFQASGGEGSANRSPSAAFRDALLRCALFTAALQRGRRSPRRDVGAEGGPVPHSGN